MVPLGGEQPGGGGGGDDAPARQATGGPAERGQFPAGDQVGLHRRAQGGWQLTKDLGDQPRLADQGAVGPLLGATQGGELLGGGGRVADGGLGRGELGGQPVIGWEWTRDPQEGGRYQGAVDPGGDAPVGVQGHAPEGIQDPNRSASPHPWRTCGPTAARRRACVLGEAWAQVAKIGDRFAALQPIYGAVIDRWGHLDADVARGLSLCHDWGP
jgi:hypothetical protein